MPAARDRASVTIGGSFSYANSGDSTAGNVTVGRDTIGVTSVNGSLELLGKQGGTATFGVSAQRFWIFQLWVGQVSAFDPNAGLSVSAPVFGQLQQPAGAASAGGTSNWFSFGTFPNLIRPFTLTWSVEDRA
ncbi:MAG: hypothetical protein ACOYOP_09980 [Microthrixaceae bacterium]